MFSKMMTGISTKNFCRKEELIKLKEAISSCDAIILGAGAGLSTSAGFTYSGERFERYFSDFAKKFGIRDIYSGGFYPFPDAETRWGWWSRHIYINRYVKAPKPVYDNLYELVKNKEYFVITTNVDHQFQKAGFDKEHLFYTQGDYGLWQCSKPCHRKTYDNKSNVVKMLYSQGLSIDASGGLAAPDFNNISMRISSDLIPYCPVCGEEMSMNLRSDDTFVEDEGWNKASGRYSDFIEKHSSDKVLFLELGVGANTPVIIKYPLWKMTKANENAIYACLNYGEAFCPVEIADRSICIDGDIGDVLKAIKA